MYFSDIVNQNDEDLAVLLTNLEDEKRILENKIKDIRQYKDLKTDYEDKNNMLTYFQSKSVILLKQIELSRFEDQVLTMSMEAEIEEKRKILDDTYKFEIEKMENVVSQIINSVIRRILSDDLSEFITFMET